MTETLGVYPLFFMSNWLDNLFIILFGAKFYLKLKQRCRSTTAPVVFLLILFLESCLIFLPYSIMFLFYDVPYGLDIWLFVMTWLHLGNFIPFSGVYTYNFAWVPALLFQCQTIMTLIYCISVVKEISLVSVLFVAMGVSASIYIILSAICYFSLTLEIDYFMPVVFHNPLSVFHNFSLGFLVSYMTDDKRHTYLNINRHGKPTTDAPGRLDHNVSSPVTKKTKLKFEVDADAEVEVQQQNDMAQSFPNTVPALSPQDPIQQHENPADFTNEQDMNLLLSPENPTDIGASLALNEKKRIEQSVKRRLKLCCPCKNRHVENVISQASPRAGDTDSCTSAKFAQSTMDAAFWHPVRHRHRCKFLCEKVTKDKNQWLSSKLYAIAHNHRRFGDVLAIIPILAIYGTFTALGTETGVVYDKVLDETLLIYETKPNITNYIILLLARIVIPILFSVATYYIMVSSTYALEWLMHRTFLTWVGKSALPILYIEPVVISFISTNTGAIKIGPYSISIFLLYLLGGIFVCILIGTCLNTLMEELVRVVMDKSWSSFDRYKASLIAKRYRRQLNGER